MKRYIKTIIYAILGYIALAIYLNQKYDFLVSLSFLFLLYFFYKTDNSYDKRTRIYSLILAIILSLCLSIGNIVVKYTWPNNIEVFTHINMLYIILMSIGFTIIINRLFLILLPKWQNINLFSEERKLTKKKFIILWGIILLCWLPWLLRYYPAIMTNDSYYVIHYVNNGILSDAHTFGHTWFFGIFFLLGMKLTNNMYIGILLGILVQMVLLSLMFTYLVYKLYNLGLKKSICLLIFLFYAISPLHASYSITLWRDILFSGIFITLSISIYEYIKNNYKLKISNIIIISLSLLILLFFRNNGIYIFMLSTILLVILIPKNRLITLISGVVIISLYFIIKGPGFNYFGIAKTRSTEAYSIPIQQISRTITLHNDLTNEEYKVLNKIMNVEKVASVYNPTIVDPVKNIINVDKFNQNKKEFITLWLSLLKRHPKTYIESYFLSTLGYYYPSVSYWVTGGLSEGIFESEDIKNIPLTKGVVNNIIDKVKSNDNYFSNFIWSIGTYVFAFIISIFVLLYNHKAKYLSVYIPVFSLWITLLIATPVFAEFRYIYGLFCVIPLLIVLPFNNKKEMNK